MATNGYEVEKFDGQRSFKLWRAKMRALLVTQGLYKALKGKDSLPASMTEDEKEDLMERAHSAIQLSLTDEVLQEVVDEETVAGLWSKLEKLYLHKPQATRLDLKHRLYTLRMKEGSGTQPGQKLHQFSSPPNTVIMATQPDGNGSSVDPSGKKKYGKGIRWTPNLNHRFMEYVAEEVRKGHKRNNTLDKEGWAHVKERFLNESSITLSFDQLRNHFDKTRRLWQGWRYLATQTGLGWDQVSQTYMAPDSFWEEFKKMYKDGFRLRWRGLSYEEEQYLQTIYGGSVAIGEDRCNPSSGTIPPNEDERDLDPVEPVDNDDESTPNEENIPSNVEINNPPTMEQMNTPKQLQLGTRSRASTPSSLYQPRTRRRRRSETSSTESSMGKACDIMEERTKLMKRAFAPESTKQAQLSSFEKSMELLEALPSFDPLNPMYTWAPSFLCKKVKRLMFISISNIQLREVWLKTEFEKSTGSGVLAN